KSEPAIVAGIARALFGDDGPVPWRDLGEDYHLIREAIAHVVPGFEDFNRRVRRRGGFRLPSGAQRREFTTPSGKASFTTLPLPRCSVAHGSTTPTYQSVRIVGRRAASRGGDVAALPE